MLYYDLYGASLVAQTVKNLPAMQETWVQSLGWEDSPEQEVATPSTVLAWEITWTKLIPRWATVHGFAKSRTRLNSSSNMKYTSYYHLWAISGVYNYVLYIAIILIYKNQKLKSVEMKTEMSPHHRHIYRLIPWTTCISSPQFSLK